jgi:DUF971 family protein
MAPMTAPSDTPRPIHIEVERERGLLLRWSDGAEHFLAVGLLRRQSPSADMRELRAEMARNPFTVIPANTATQGPLRIDAVEPVGHYALRIRFSDGHDTGIYTWSYLRGLCEAHPKADGKAP